MCENDFDIFRSEICFHSYFWPALTFPLNHKFISFPISGKSKARDGRTDGRRATLNAAPEEGHIISVRPENRQ